MNKIYIKIEHTMAWDESSKDYFTFNDTDCHTCGKPKAECCCQDCNPCAKKERECCVPNIVADWDCIKVETDSEWVIHLSTRCNPQITSEDKSVTVKLDESWDVDVWDLSVKDMNNFVWACAADKHPSTLDEKIVWVSPITVTPVCSDNGQIEIGIDLSEIETDNNKVSVSNWCPEWYLKDVLIANSSYVDLQKQWCKYVLIDKNNQSHYYAKLVLRKAHIWWNIPKDSEWETEEWLWQKAPVYWMPVRSWTSDIEAPSSLRSWLEFYNWTNEDPRDWWIKITKKWLYQVWFTWSAEFNYWIHAFRIQMYRRPAAGQGQKKYTICESRYSGPLGWEPFTYWFWSIDLNYVRNVTLESGRTVDYVDRASYSKKLDFPLLSNKTEEEWIIHERPHSQSLWAIMDRVPVTANTIVELDVGDMIYIWMKASTTIQVPWEWWDYLDKLDSNSECRIWHRVLLWHDFNQSDNGWEAWFSFYANLIHPLV